METTVSLVQMLDARERRVQHQQELLARYHKPLICFTMNICGPIKDSPLIRRGFARGRQLLRQQFLRAKLTPLYQDAVREVTGCEAFYVLDADPLTIKKFTTDIEDATPLGRLFDMDVIRPDGLKVDREELDLEGRRCLICGGPAKVCSSRRIHTVAELQEKTTEILTEARDAQDIADAARLAVRALLYEVTTTPKPGLVDRRNSGSHKDMDVFTWRPSRPCGLWVVRPRARCWTPPAASTPTRARSFRWASSARRWDASTAPSGPKQPAFWRKYPP